MVTAVAGQRLATDPAGREAPLLVYFSSISGNTARFVEKLGRERCGSPSTTQTPSSSSMSRSCS